MISNVFLPFFQNGQNSVTFSFDKSNKFLNVLRLSLYGELFVFFATMHLPGDVCIFENIEIEPLPLNVSKYFSFSEN